MKRLLLVLCSGALLMGIFACATDAGSDAGPRRVRFTTDRAAGGAGMSALELEYAAVIDVLLPGMGAEKITDRRDAQQRFEQISLRAGRPGAEDERAALCKSIVARLGPETVMPARVWLLRKIETIGQQESVGVLSELLHDDEPRIRELARRALQKNTADSAAAALRDALDAARQPAWRVALINALADRDDRASIDRFVQLADAQHAAVAAAALAALGDLGGPAAYEKLYAVWRADDDARHELAVDALLRVADRYAAADQHKQAARIFNDLWNSDLARDRRVAALRGLALADARAALPELLRLITAGEDEWMKRVAARLMERLDSDATTPQLLAELDKSSPEARAIILEVLAARGEAAAKPAVLTALGSDDASVRAAALRAMQTLGGAGDVVRLAEAAANAMDAERDAAREALGRLRGADVDDAILAAARREPAANVRAELLRSIPRRHTRNASLTLFEAAKDDDEAVRVAAFEALGELASDDDLDTLVAALKQESGEEASEAAENAVVAICLRDDDEAQRAAPVLAALSESPGPTDAPLIRVLGRVRGAKALEVIRAALQSREPEVLDAGVRALAKWDDAAVLDDLLRIARDSSLQTHPVLALRAFVRLARLPSERDLAQTLQMLKDAMSLARQEAEKKLVLGALKDVPIPDTLEFARSYLDDPQLRDEAAIAMLQLSRGLVARNREEAMSAIEAVRNAYDRNRVQRTLDETVAFIEQHDGYIADWMISGPYTREGTKARELFTIAFAPETPDAHDLEWKPLDIAGDADNPWIFDLNRFSAGSERCVYVKTAIRSPKQQPARLEIGSDDAVMAWLNGDLVHSNLTFRGIQPGADKVKVSLNEGWNTLMLKIVQGSGGWGFICGVKASDGKSIPGLEFRAE